MITPNWYDGFMAICLNFNDFLPIISSHICQLITGIQKSQLLKGLMLYNLLISELGKANKSKKWVSSSYQLHQKEDSFRTTIPSVQN